jgi:hypothetical protein
MPKRRDLLQVGTVRDVLTAPVTGRRSLHSLRSVETTKLI